MQVSQAGLDLIRKFEKLMLSPYLDEAKVPTIGYGTTVYPNGKHVAMQDADIDARQADCYLEYDASQTADAVRQMVGPLTEIKQNQFDALVSFAYNVGTGALHGSTLLKYVKAHESAENIRVAFLMWDKVHIDGKLVESAGLKYRRNKEADLYLS